MPPIRNDLSRAAQRPPRYHVESDGDILGDTKTLLSRLVEEAQKEQIVTSSKTAESMGRSYKNRMRQLQPIQVKGKTGVGLCEFVWRAGTQTAIVRPLHANPTGGRSLRLKQGSAEIVSAALVTIGRDLECNLLVLDELASRHHCSIEPRGEGFVLIDHSTNGTYVTEEGNPEVMVEHRHFALHAHGWLAFGQPRARTSQVVEYFCA